MYIRTNILFSTSNNIRFTNNGFHLKKSSIKSDNQTIGIIEIILIKLKNVEKMDCIWKNHLFKNDFQIHLN
jgi:hypothetical protein